MNMRTSTVTVIQDGMIVSSQVPGRVTSQMMLLLCSRLMKGAVLLSSLAMNSKEIASTNVDLSIQDFLRTGEVASSLRCKLNVTNKTSEIDIIDQTKTLSRTWMLNPRRRKRRESRIFNISTTLSMSGKRSNQTMRLLGGKLPQVMQLSSYCGPSCSTQLSKISFYWVTTSSMEWDLQSTFTLKTTPMDGLTGPLVKVQCLLVPQLITCILLLVDTF